MDMKLTKVNETVVAKAAARCKEKGIIIPTLAQQMDPTLIPQDIQDKLKNIEPDHGNSDDASGRQQRQHDAQQVHA